MNKAGEIKIYLTALTEGTTWQTGMDARIILKWMLKK
jgi:hypothetical protein